MKILCGCGVLLAASCGDAAPADSSTTRPNILLILADDLGYSDIGCFGGEIETPNLDSLAANGVRFTQFYNAARCCPSRASLLTGLYPHQTGMGHMMFDRKRPGYRGDLNEQCATIAEVLAGSADYRTYAVGKWHLSLHDKPDSPRHNWPLQRGFEKYYGLIWGYSSFYDPAIVRGNDWYSCESDPEYKPEKYYFTDALTDNAIKFLQQHEKESPGNPFFLYQAYTAAHWPMHALEKDIAKYKGRFDGGYDKVRQERVARLRKLGMLDDRWTPAPTDENWNDVKNREFELRCMEVYAAMIDNMDHGIGRITAELKRQGKFDNTLILFLQDNGGCAEDRGRLAPVKPAPRDLRPLRPEELPASTIPAQTRDGRPMRGGPTAMPGPEDTYISYGKGWANVSNTPFREYKHWVHEGGIATPLIVHWPNAIPKESRNTLVANPAHLIDIMPTCIDVAKTTYPAERKGAKLPPMEGVSLLPVITGAQELKRAQPIFWEHEGNRAVRDGKWKLVAKEYAEWELYDMDAGRTEMHDIAAAHQGKVQELDAKWNAWAARTNVLPLGGWKRAAGEDKNAPPVRLTLKQGEELTGEKIPHVHDRALTITVAITRASGDGVLVSQGGLIHGYTLYVQDHKLYFGLRRDSELQTISTELVDDSPTTITAALSPRGALQLYRDGKLAASKRRVGLLPKTPAQGLSRGFDSEDAVGDYVAPFKYAGELGEVQLETGELQ